MKTRYAIRIYIINISISCRSTSSMYSTTLKETPQKKKLIERNLKLRANRMLGERIRQLQKKIENLENKKTTKNETTKDN